MLLVCGGVRSTSLRYDLIPCEQMPKTYFPNSMRILQPFAWIKSIQTEWGTKTNARRFNIFYYMDTLYKSLNKGNHK